MAHKFVLSIADYIVIAIILIISACIGVYFRFTGGRQRTNEEYLLGGRGMPIFPVAFSLMATFMSATSLMGVPAEMYLFGTHMAFMNVGFVLGPILAAWLFLPIYFDIGASTSFEYLENRYGKSIRRILSAAFLLQIGLLSAVSLYAPALALSAVTDLPLWLAITSVGVVCTFYCTFGGIKAVLWTDVFQAILMFAGLLVIIIKGCMDVGGFGNVFKFAYDGGRLTVPSLAIDTNDRYTMLNVFLQGLIITFASYGCSQIQVQRLLTVKDFRHSVVAALVSIPMLNAFHLACCLCGLIFYAVFRFCDPLSSAEKQIQSADQLMPYYITIALSNLPGLPGLCIAGIFSASLSTVSSSVNAMAAVTVEDFIRPVRPDYANSVVLSKVLTVFFGVLCVFLSFMGGVLGHLVKTSLLVIGLFYGITLAVYLLASLSTVTNEKGAILGVLAGTCLGIYLSVIASQTVHEILPLSNECRLHNLETDSLIIEPLITQFTLNSTLASFNSPSSETSTSIRGLSYMWITPITFVTSLTIGYISSLIFSLIEGESRDVPMIHLSPIRRRFCKDKLKIVQEQKNNRQINELKELSAKISNF